MLGEVEKRQDGVSGRIMAAERGEQYAAVARNCESNFTLPLCGRVKTQDVASAP